MCELLLDLARTDDAAAVRSDEFAATLTGRSSALEPTVAQPTAMVDAATATVRSPAPAAAAQAAVLRMGLGTRPGDL